MNQNLSSYFSMKRSPTLLYYPPKIRYGSRYWLEDYLKDDNYSKKFPSFRCIFEDWIFKEIKGMRIHKAHRESYVIQDKLQEGKYKIEIEDLLKEFTFNEIDKIEKNIFTFILWIKHFVARQYYSNNEELINYLLKSHLT